MAQKFAAYSTTGALTGFYDADDSPVPAGLQSIAITDAEWQEAIVTPGYTVANGVFTPPSAAAAIAAAQIVQSSLLTKACVDAITSGFHSAALGEANFYGSALSDQQNLSDAMNGSLVPGIDSLWTTPLWCASPAGVWTLTPHSASEVQQLHSDWVAFRLAQQTQLASLKTAVGEAASAAAVQAIAWS